MWRRHNIRKGTNLESEEIFGGRARELGLSSKGAWLFFDEIEEWPDSYLLFRNGVDASELPKANNEIENLENFIVTGELTLRKIPEEAEEE